MIDWNALQSDMDSQAWRVVCGLIKQRARDMLAGRLPLHTCKHAAAIVARVERRLSHEHA